MITRIADQHAYIAARLKELEPDPTAGAFGKIEVAAVECMTCDAGGWVDERLGGGPRTGWVVCPDCGNPEGKPSP